jgi:hypothetical protein
MARAKKIPSDEKLAEKSELFMQNVSSDMSFKSELTNDSMSFDWVNQIEFSCPYIDNIVRNPKVALIKEEEVVKIEKARKITVASVKDLSKHTHFIEKIDKVTNEVRPSKILIEHHEETFNTYENRFIYTLIDNLLKFIMRKEVALENFKTKNDKVLEYAASTNNGYERVEVELKISSKELPKGSKENDFQKELDDLKKRIKKMKDYIASWKRSEMLKSLEKAHVSFVVSPIKKTNMILKNPNFQIAMKLWDFLQTYDYEDTDGSKDGLDTTGDDVLKGILDESFLIDYCVFDSISSSKREQKEKLSKYAVIMVKKEIQRAVSLLLNCGIKITDEEIIAMITSEIKNEKEKRAIGSTDIKKKFQSAMDEYLERTQDYL